MSIANLKVLHINVADNLGGAAKAAYRLHHALLSSGVNSRMLVNMASTGDWTVEGPAKPLDKVLIKIKPHIARWLRKLLISENNILHSFSIFPSGLIEKINSCDADVIHLHWIQGEMLSIKDVAKIKKPIVWTLHDMWAFCGAEHVAWDNRWNDGYRADNRPNHELGLDLNRWTWTRKCKHWVSPLQVVTPSRWLGTCVKSSHLMRNWPLNIVPNCLNLDQWKPEDKNSSREILGLPKGRRYVLFGMHGGNAAHHKGFDLLIESLASLKTSFANLELVVFGQMAPKNQPNYGIPVRYMGNLNDDVTLKMLYSASDVMVIPSRQDNLPNTGVESMACGTPVVAFNTCGLPDIVKHQETGYLAEPFNPQDLAKGIVWVLENEDRLQQLGLNARKHALEHFASDIVANQYIAIYKQTINNSLQKK